ncbi:hypothetical protein, partial [Albidovulum sp.]
MTCEIGSDLEIFLIEDVILTLGNLRAALAWLIDAELLTTGERAAWINRLEFQIDSLHDRARALQRRGAGMDPLPENIFAVDLDAPAPPRLAIAAARRRAAADAAGPTVVPIFHSRRGGAVA